MGRKKDLPEDEKREIVQYIATGMKPIDISRKLKRDHRTVKRFVSDSQHRRIQGLLRKVSVRQINVIKRAAIKKPLLSSKQVFEAAGVSGVPRTSRCRILQRLAVVHKAAFRSPLTKAHKERRLQWAQNYMKTYFQTVLFTDECRATLDGPDGWSSGWLVNGHPVPTRLRRQQGGGGVMIWAGILGSEMVGPFRGPDSVKMTSARYVEFLTDHFLLWYRKKNHAFQNKMIFMQDNAPSHAAKNTIDSLIAMGLKREKNMVWPPSSPDLKPVENLWSFLKMKIYEGGRQYTSKQQLWEAILASSNEILPETTHGLTSSMHERIVSHLQEGCIY